MNNLTPKKIKEILLEFCPKQDGYIKNLTRRSFEDLIVDLFDIDISEDSDSNQKRLKKLLKDLNNEQIEVLLKKLRNI